MEKKETLHFFPPTPKTLSFYETTNNKAKDIIREIQTNIPYDHKRKILNKILAN